MKRTKDEYNKAIHFYQNIINAFNADLPYYRLLIKKLKPKNILELFCGSTSRLPKKPKCRPSGFAFEPKLIGASYF